MHDYDLAIEFDVARRIGWSDEDLGDHIDDVFDRLRQARGLTGMDAEADLDTGRATVTLHYSVMTEDDPEHFGRVALGVAIRSCGGGHNGLLPFSEEAAHKPERNQWSGLRTPSWNVRQVNLTKIAS
ncbi:MAG: hypothetical protein ACR2N2_02635 [Acidimicrobiia bacterium]